jgi:hypothetical protein
VSRPSFPHLPAEAWELYLRDELTGPSLESIESHLAGCGDCSRALEQADPSFLFRRLRDLPLREQALTGFWDDVRSEIEPAAPARSSRRERFALLAGAATVLLGVLMLQLLPQTSSSTEPCLQLALSSSECRSLFQDVRFDDEPALFVETSADLAGLL